MPRRPGSFSRAGSTVIAVRVPNDLAEAAYARCGGKESFAQWMRDVIRYACSKPLDRDAGYQEGFAAGWSDANRKFRSALQGADTMINGATP